MKRIKLTQGQVAVVVQKKRLELLGEFASE